MTAPRFLFVHGAFHGGWCFDLLGLELKRRAVRCTAIDLPAMGDDTGDLASATFEAGVERVLGAMAGSRRGPVVVAHSFGALYATEAALRAGERVRSLVYLASYVPVAGDSFATLQEVAPLTPEFQAALGRSADGSTLLFDESRALDLLYHDVPEGIAQAAISRLKPQPLEPFRGAAITEDAETLGRLRRRALFAENDRVLPPELCVAMAERAGVPVETIPTGHCPFLSMPRLLADQLLEVS